MPNFSSGRRLKYIDIVKGVAILLMIYGHWDTTHSSVDIRLIFSFHMPLFFIISGYFLKAETPCGVFLRKRAKQLLSPYYITSVVTLLMTGLMAWYDGREMWNTVQPLVPRLLYGCTDSERNVHIIGNLSFRVGCAGAIWFLWALLWAMLVVKLALRVRYSWLIVLIITFLGHYSHKHTGLFPLSLQAGMNASLFVLLGYYFRKYRLFEHRYFRSLWVQTALLTLWFVVAYTSYFSAISVCLNSTRPSFMVTSISMTCFLVYVSQKLESLPIISSFLALCGRASLLLLCVHSITLYLPQPHFFQWQIGAVAGVLLFREWYEQRQGLCVAHGEEKRPLPDGGSL